jgi:hypothetical protein
MQLVCGNSLIGARRAVYSSELLRPAGRGAASWKDGPPVPLKNAARPKGTVYHFLIPWEGMAEYGDRTIKRLLPEGTAAVKRWRRAFCKPFSPGEVERLEALSEAVDALWTACAEEQARLREEMTDSLPVFGRPAPEKPAATSRHKDLRYASEILSRRVRASSPYRRLKLALDYWCALWFWPLEKADQLPSREEWLFDLAGASGGVIDRRERAKASFHSFPPWRRRRRKPRPPCRMVNVETLLSGNGRLRTADELARSTLSALGGRVRRHLRLPGRFRLVLGNPPWIKVEWTEGDVLGDPSPLFVFRNYSATQMASCGRNCCRTNPSGSGISGPTRRRRGSRTS